MCMYMCVCAFLSMFLCPLDDSILWLDILRPFSFIVRTCFLCSRCSLILPLAMNRSAALKLACLAKPCPVLLKTSNNWLINPPAKGKYR